MKVLRCDSESAMMTPEMGIWLSKQGIARRPKGRGSHAHLAEAHIRLIRDAMRHLDEDAKQNGMELSVRELVILCVAARNIITEYGGFSPTQALYPGYIPSDWGSSGKTDDARGKVSR